MRKRLFITTFALAGTMLLSGHAMAQQQQQPGQGPAMAWQQERATSQGAVLTISPSTVRQIQLRLNSAGFDTGNVDGTWGQQTSQALASFQKTYGLEPTGQINVNTLSALGINLSGGMQGQAQYGVAPQFGGQQRFQQQPQYQQQPGFQGGQQFQQPQYQQQQQPQQQQPQQQ